LLFFFCALRDWLGGPCNSQDRDAAQQMGVDVNAVNRAVFAIAGVGRVSGLLVGMYYNYIDPR